MSGTEVAKLIEHDGFDGMFTGEHIGEEPVDVCQVGVMAFRGGEKFAVDIHREHRRRSLGEQAGEVAYAGADFEDDVGGLDVAGVGDGGEDRFVDHEVLAEVALGAKAGGGEDGGDFFALHENLGKVTKSKRIKGSVRE